MSLTNSLKNAAYDNSVYISRATLNGITAAGSGGVSTKFVAHANLLLFGLNAYTTIAGTSTYTATTAQYYSGGTSSATIHVNATQLSLIRITNTAAVNLAPSLSTSTIGPFYVDQYYANGTATGGVGAVAQFSLNTSTGTAGLNGVAINQGDQIYCVNGTDATVVNLISIDYQVQPLANVVA